MDVPRLVMVADPAPAPRRGPVLEPCSLAQSPRRATLTVTMSRSGRTDTSERSPHSDARPVRLFVTGTQVLVSGRSEDGVANVPGAVELGFVGNVVEVVVDERVMC